jgi:hypothetical protein
LEKVLEYIQNNAEAIIALCALVVSVISILIGYFSLKSQQVHNRLSVRPIGKIHFITVKKRVEIKIRNDGTGPMICSNVKVYQNESDIKTNFRDAMTILQNSEYSVEYYGAGSKFAIYPGDQKTILSVYSDEITPEYVEYRNKVLAEIKKLTLELEYRDIYGQHIETLRRDKWETGR